MKIAKLLLTLASAGFFIASAHAQSGTVTNHAFALGKGPGVQGYTSLLCASAQLAVGQSAADPICQTITGDASLSAGGALTLSTVNSNVGSFGSATQSPSITVNAKGLVTAASATTITPAVGSITGLGTGVATFLGTPSSANLRAALTDEVGTGSAYFVGGALGTPASATLTNATGLPLSGLNTQAANTVVGNATGSSASPTALAPATARSSSLLNIDQATSTGDANYTILTTDRSVYHSALTAARTDTLPAANGVNAGQRLIIFDPAGVVSGTKTVTVQRAGTDTVNGVTTFVAINAANGMTECVSDGSSKWGCAQVGSSGSGGGVTSVTCNGVAITTSGTCPPSYGFANCSLAASVATNILTVALKDNAGSDPSASSPCNMYFRNVTASTGSWTQITQTAALSITTNATGATLGSSSNIAFRFWVVVFNNGGTPVIALINCSNSTTIFPLVEGQLASSTAISGSATSAGVFYTPNGTTVTSKAFLILGYIEYNSTGLATAGTYATGPNFVQTMGPGIKKPGDVVQRVSSTTTTQGTTTSATYVPLTSGLTQAITPTSAANLIKVDTVGSISSSATSNVKLQLSRGTTAATNLFGSVAAFSIAATDAGPASMSGFDFPNTTSSTTYAIQGKTLNGGNVAYPGISGDAVMITIEEIMG